MGKCPPGTCSANTSMRAFSEGLCCIMTRKANFLPAVKPAGQCMIKRGSDEEEKELGYDFI